MRVNEFKEGHFYEINGEGIFVYTHRSKGCLWFDCIIDYTEAPYESLGIPDRIICNDKIKEIDELELVEILL